MTKPNFFIVGAPKCGTSAIHQYLAEHRDVFMCDPKEPGYWSRDFGGLLRRRSVPLESLDDYLKLFAGAQHSVVGEGSTLYLASQTAIPDLLQFNPAAKLLVMLRNPVDFVVSFHRQKTFDLNEDMTDFGRAWQLQSERAAGRHIPPHCHEPAVLQYETLGRFGTQLQRVQNLVDHDQVKVVLMDDLQQRPRETFESVLSFLQLPSEGRTDFPRVNDARTFRFRFLQVLYSQDLPILGPTVRFARRVGAQSEALRSFWNSVRAKPQRKATISQEVRAELHNVFGDEIGLLEELLQRDLSAWRSTAAPSS